MDTGSSSNAQVQREEAKCDLCQLSLPSQPVVDEQGNRFCCHGCAHVNAILQVVGDSSEKGQKALETARNKGLISSRAYEKKKIELSDTVREEARLHIDQLSCPSCAWLVESVIEKTPGVAAAEVDYYSDTARVVFDLSKTTVEDITRSIRDAGYLASELKEERSKKETRNLMRLAIAFFLAMNQMMFAWVGYGIIYADNGITTWSWLVPWLQLIMAVPVVTWCALPLYQRALAAIDQGKVVMESLLSLGIIAATLISAFSFYLGQENMYFETASMLVALSLAGRWLENWVKHRTSKSLTDLLHFSPVKARNSEGRFQPLSEFQIGDEIVVEVGETVPLDVLSRNNTVVKEGLLTGESHPVERPAGSLLLAGSIVEKGPVTGRVERSSGSSVADTMRDRVMESLRNVDEGSRLADRLAQGFVPLVIIVSVFSFIWHLANGADIIFAALTCVAVLVVSCPCAFGVAASSALSLSVLKLARKGILVKDPAQMESATKLTTFIFDKTGTITAGELTVENIGWLETKDESVLAAVKSLEMHSRHPVGIALSRALPATQIPTSDGVVELPGLGITGEIDGKRYAAGKAELFADANKPVETNDSSHTRVWFGIAGEEPVGYLDIADTLREEARAVINNIKSGGIKVELLSGDLDLVTKTIGEKAGINTCIGNMKPEDKKQHVRELQKAGEIVAFAGDGFNDAEALAQADTGIAMASSSNLAMVSAPIVLTRNDLHGIEEILATGKRAYGVLKGNFLWAFLYNFAMIPVAAVGLLTPVYAAALMALSSASVALNSMRLRK